MGARVGLTLLAAALLTGALILNSGCKYGLNGNNAESLGREQEQHEKILEDFSRDPSEAMAHYRQVWESSVISYESSVDPQARLAIASELLAHDPAHYDDYYQYIQSQLSSPDEAVAATAAHSLRNAQGKESMNTLIELLGDRRQVVSRDAAIALRYRFNTAMSGGSRNVDGAYIRERMQPFCGQQPEADYLRELCQTVEVKP